MLLLLIDETPIRRVPKVENTNDRAVIAPYDEPLGKELWMINERPFAGAKGDTGRSFIVAFRSAKKHYFLSQNERRRVIDFRRSINALSRSERRHWAVFHCRFAPRKSTCFLSPRAEEMSRRTKTI